MANGEQENVQSRLQDLVAYPREELDIELKSWLDIWTNDTNSKEHKADLGKAILALANHGGGYVLIGFQEANGSWSPDPNRPRSLDGYTQDAVNAIVYHYSEPPFHCSLHHVVDQQSNEIFPVVVVPGNHRVPIRSKVDSAKHIKVNCYYIRRPGPRSEQIQTAKEWDDLIGRCMRMGREELLADIRALLVGGAISERVPAKSEAENFAAWIAEALKRFQELRMSLKPDENPQRYDGGYWTFAYSINGIFDRPDLPGLLEILQQVDKWTGWPVFVVMNRPELRPKPHGDLIECWLKDTRSADPSHSDFWRASPHGSFFLLRGYDDDDNPDRVRPRTELDAGLPIWRIGECLLHAKSMAEKLKATEAAISVEVSWTGLKNRTLSNWTKPLRWEPWHYHSVCLTDTIRSATTLSPERISVALPEVVSEILAPLYVAFDFFKMPLGFIESELNGLRGR